MEKSLCIVRAQPGSFEVAWRDMDVKLRLHARKPCFVEAMPLLPVYRLVECRVFDHFGEEPAPEPGAAVHRDASEPFARATQPGEPACAIRSIQVNHHIESFPAQPAHRAEILRESSV